MEIIDICEIVNLDENITQNSIRYKEREEHCWSYQRTTTQLKTTIGLKLIFPCSDARYMREKMGSPNFCASVCKRRVARSIEVSGIEVKLHWPHILGMSMDTTRVESSIYMNKTRSTPMQHTHCYA